MATTAYTTQAASGKQIVARRHREYTKKAVRWQFLLDSWEGGEEYRQAEYGLDRYRFPIRNLVRHKREYPSPADDAWSAGGRRNAIADPSQYATDDDYEMRRARTPVPTFTKEAVETHLADIYAQEVRRNVPVACNRWFEDVDGCGTPFNDWMQETVAPLILVLGQIDVVLGLPQPPGGVKPQTRAEEMAGGLDRVVASIVMPTNVVWWLLDSKGRYREVLIQEHSETEGDGCSFRHWHERGWELYDKDGKLIGGESYPYGRPPIVRLFYRKSPRYRNVGMSLYEDVAEHQREYYNRDSELILSDTIQAHPLMQGPEDYMIGDNTIPIGPGYLLPKKKHAAGTTVSYEGFEVVEFPKDGAQSIRDNKKDLRDQVDRSAALVKPAGAAGTTGETVAQSGVSKRIDLKPGERILSKIAAKMEFAEKVLCELCCLVAGVKDSPRIVTKPRPKGTPAAQPPTGQPGEIEIVYPREFDLFGPEEFAAMIGEFQAMLQSAGNAPTIEADAIKAYVRMILRGRPEEVYASYDAEIDKVLAKLAKAREEERAIMQATQEAAIEANQAQASAEDAESGEPSPPPRPAA